MTLSQDHDPSSGSVTSGQPDMVQRVAQALRSIEVMGGIPFPMYLREEAALRFARAAIEAMREPTDAMANAGFEFTGDPCWPEDVAKAWRAMIDATLSNG